MLSEVVAEARALGVRVRGAAGAVRAAAGAARAARQGVPRARSAAAQPLRDPVHASAASAAAAPATEAS